MNNLSIIIKNSPKFLTYLVLFCAVSYKTFAQDETFSQFYASPLQLNPALAGLETNTYASINHRSQFRGTKTPAQFNLFSFIKPLYSKDANYDKHLGAAYASVYNEMSGDGLNFRCTGLNVGGAYNLNLSKDAGQVISFALQGGFYQKRFGGLNDLTWGSQYNQYSGYDGSIEPSIGNQSSLQKMYPVINAGMVWFRNPPVRTGPKFMTIKSFAGLAASNLNSPNESVLSGSKYKLPIIIKLHGGIELISAKSYVTVSPNAYILTQNGRYQVNLGSYVNYRLGGTEEKHTKISFGTWYRVKGSFIYSAGISTSNYTLAFSYDSDINSLRYNARGGSAFELSLIYEIAKEKKIKKYSTPLF